MKPLSEKDIEILTNRILSRIEKANTYTLQEIAKALRKTKGVTASQAHKLAQVLKYEGNYKKIEKELQRMTELNLKEIKEIFEVVAKKNTEFAKQFYKYRNMKPVSFDENGNLKNIVNGFINRARKDYINLADMSVSGLASKQIGYSVRDKDNKIVFKGVKQTYMDAIDDAVFNISTGQRTFADETRRILNELGKSGLKKVDFESGRSIRLDSILRMNMQSTIKDLHNQMQLEMGKQFKSNGIEITVHSKPAPDHQEAQGKQFSNKEYEKLQETGYATSYDKIDISLHEPLKNGEIPDYFRPISEYNCYHYIFAIILGVNEPQYSNEQLKKIIDDANRKIKYKGKEITAYQATQIQRKIETEVRKEKDMQIMAKELGNKDEVILHQKNIKALMVEYNDLNKQAGLEPKKSRLTVPGYHYTPYNKKDIDNDDE